MTRVREARPNDRLPILRILDGAMLETDSEGIEAAIDRGETLVAHENDRILGALVFDGSHIEAVAVRRNRRDQGIGSALVGAAAARTNRLTATFASNARPFYESLGFEIESRDEGRLYGRLDHDS